MPSGPLGDLVATDDVSVSPPNSQKETKQSERAQPSTTPPSAGDQGARGTQTERPLWGVMG